MMILLFDIAFTQFSVLLTLFKALLARLEEMDRLECQEDVI
jgi:hypothetical protein